MFLITTKQTNKQTNIMISDSTTLNSLFISAQGRDDDDVSINSTDIYDCYLQPDNYDDTYEDLEDLEDDTFFESSQLHQLVQTQPVQLINEQDLIDRLPQPQELVVEETSHCNGISPMMTSRSSSMSSTFSKRNSLYGNVPESIDEEMDLECDESMVGRKAQPLFSAFNSIYNNTAQYEDYSAPRSFAIQESALEIGAEVNQYATSDLYHYSIQKSSNTRYATDEEIEFVKTLSSKLSRYSGYFTAGSKDQEYSDKVRFQEISYKFSKTYV